MFIDEVVIEVYGGRGGHGMTSFRREKYVPFGGPSGGNGGSGGSVIFVGDEGKLTLMDFRYQKHIKASNGENGKSKGMHGANSENKYIKVPLGTIVYNFETNVKVGEVMYHGQELVVAKGGKGGRGNIAFASNRNPAPKFSENGDKGETLKLKLDLSVLADVGLLGYPSVGKSTFISVVSNAKPKIADYPFTTLAPNLGMVRHKGTDFVLADLPGLIENASEGVGLGIRFLKHIERCRIFLHFLDLTREEPIKDYEIINKELTKYNSDLLNRKQIIVLNKLDVAEEEKLTSVKSYFKDNDIHIISAVSKEGVNSLLDDVILELENIPPLVSEEESHQLYELKEDVNIIEVSKTDGIYYVTGNKVSLFYDRTNFNEEEGIMRFAQQLKTIGVFEKLEETDIENGDTVNVYGYEFEYIK